MKEDNVKNCGCEDEACGCHSHEHEDCGCGCGCEDEKFVVDLEDENGNTVPCEMVDAFQFKDKDYILVQNPKDGSVYLFRVEGEDEEAELEIPGDEEFQEVSAYYESLSDEE